MAIDWSRARCLTRLAVVIRQALTPLRGLWLGRTKEIINRTYRSMRYWITSYRNGRSACEFCEATPSSTTI